MPRPFALRVLAKTLYELDRPVCPLFVKAILAGVFRFVDKTRVNLPYPLTYDDLAALYRVQVGF